MDGMKALGMLVVRYRVYLSAARMLNLIEDR